MRFNHVIKTTYYLQVSHVSHNVPPVFIPLTIHTEQALLPRLVTWDIVDLDLG